MSIANRLKRAREKLDITQEQAARQWGVNVRTLQDWELGRNEPRGFARTQLEKLLAEILGDAVPGARRGRDGL